MKHTHLSVTANQARRGRKGRQEGRQRGSMVKTCWLTHVTAPTNTERGSAALLVPTSRPCELLCGRERDSPGLDSQSKHYRPTVLLSRGRLRLLLPALIKWRRGASARRSWRQPRRRVQTNILTARTHREVLSLLSASLPPSVHPRRLRYEDHSCCVPRRPQR